MSSLERNFNSSSTIVASPKRLPAFDSSRGENFSRTLHYRSSKIGVEIIVRLQHSKYIFFESSRSLSIVYRFEVSILGNYRELEGQSLERKERKEKSRRMARVEQRGLGLDFVKMQPDRDENGSAQSLLFFFFLFLCNKLYTILNKYLNPRARTLSPTFNTPRCGNILFLKYSTHYFFTHRPSTNFV